MTPPQDPEVRLQYHGTLSLVRDYYLMALNTGRFDRLDTLLAEDFVDHETMIGIPPTRDGLKTKYGLLRAGFSDFAFAVEDLLADRDRVAVRVTVSGTHDGVFMGRPPTGRRFQVASVGIFRVADGRLAEHWGVFDQLGMLGQLGVMG